MCLGQKIAYYRKEKGMTQESVARCLGISNQAVSKWETGQSSPDVTLLPQLADILEITLDELFGRTSSKEDVRSQKRHPLPWDDDQKLRMVLYEGHRLVQKDELTQDPHGKYERLQFSYSGMARGVESCFNVTCGDVSGNVKADGSVECCDVGGNVNAKGDVKSGDVGGNVHAGGSVECGVIYGHLRKKKVEILMPKTVYDQEFETKIKNYFDASLPDKIFDAHVHISRDFTKRSGYEGEPYQQFREFTEKYISSNLAGAMVMPQVSSEHTEETLDDDNQYNLKLTREQNHSAGLIIRPQCGRDKTEKLLDANPQIKVLKPYLVYATGVEDTGEADISTFATEWMWELANDREMPMLLHLSHFVDGLSHPSNIAELKYFCKKYPRVKLVLAHCAMGHNVPKLAWGLEAIKGLDNVWFDSSGASEPMASYYCVKHFGVEKLLYGGDFDFATIYGRIASYGSTFSAVRPNPERDKADFYRPLNNGQECLLGLLQAMEVLGLSAADREKIFYGNAAELYG